MPLNQKTTKDEKTVLHLLTTPAPNPFTKGDRLVKFLHCFKFIFPTKENYKRTKYIKL